MTMTRPDTATDEPAPPSSPSEQPPAVRVLRHFRVVFNAVKTHFQQVEKRAGIGGAQVWALSVLQAHPGLGMSDLSRHMDIHQTTASNLVKSMVSAGLARTTRREDDRRAVSLHITEAGQAVLERAPGPFAGVLPQALSELDPHTLERLDQDLLRLIDRLQPEENAAKVPLAQL